MSIFKAYDIRGLYPSEVNEKIIYNISRAFVDFIHCKKIVVGRDMRLSSPSLYNAVVKAITDQGCDVINVGIVSTPMFYYAVNKIKAGAGVMITASHNPGEYNGLKLVRAEAVPLNYDTGIKLIEEKVKNKDFKDVDDKGLISQAELLQDYINYVKTYASNVKDLKVVIDSGNGMAGKTIKKLLQEFPIKLISMYDELDGSFPNHEANPFKPETMKDLQAKVIEEKADVGFAFDGDADRMIMVDEKGNRVPGDITTALIAKKLLENNKGEKMMYDLRSTKSVPELIKKEGGVPLVSRIGHSFIKTRMKKEKVLFAGEMSGHYYFRDNFYTDSTAIPVVLILSLLAGENKKVSELTNNIMKYYHSGEINREVSDKKIVLKRVEEAYKDAKISRLDGITVEYDDWWFNLRESNTEPVIRLNLEADTKELMIKKRGEVLKLIH